MHHMTHEPHAHQHTAGCGHTAIQHGDHVDYLHEGHLHRLHSNHVDECSIPEDARNPARCTPQHDCAGHDTAHRHGPGCGHEAIPHGDHTDYLVNGHLHHPHTGHCDEHGALQVVS
jgi:hypothetical protein